MKRLFFTIAAAFTFLSSCFAQSGGLNFVLGFPMGEFKESIDRLGWGLSGHVVFWDSKPNMPFTFGFDIGYLNYGSESRLEPFSLTIPDVTVQVDRTNNLVNFHLLFQVIPPSGTVRPYIEGLFGGAYLYTETQIKSRGTEEVASSNNFDDWAWNYGAGAGMLIQVSENEEGEGDIFIDLKGRYLFGSEAEYLKEGSVIINNGRVTYNILRSKTDLLTVHLGVVARFSSFGE